jgi:hypothetical protein
MYIAHQLLIGRKCVEKIQQEGSELFLICPRVLDQTLYQRAIPGILGGLFHRLLPEEVR